MVNFWGTLLYINVMIMLGASRIKKHIFNYTLITIIVQNSILSLLSTVLDPYYETQMTIFHTRMTTQLYLQPASEMKLSQLLKVVKYPWFSHTNLEIDK